MLVITSAGYNEETLLDASGLPHSSALKLTETYRLRRGGRELEVRMQVEDDGVFTRAWETVQRFDRLPGERIREDVCELRLGLYVEGTIDSLMAPSR